MRTFCVLVCVLPSLALPLQPAAPPEKRRELTAGEKKEVARLEQEFDRNIEAGEFKGAVKSAQRIVDYRGERQGNNHWEVINARWNVKTWQRPAEECLEARRAFTIAAEGNQLLQKLRHRESEAKLREALIILEKVLGEQHPNTADCYNIVGYCLEDLGRHADALPLLRKALAIRQEVLGEEHPETASSCNNVAACLNVLGKYAEALPLSRKALAIWQTVLGENHPNTALGYNSLAFCLNAQRKHAEALPLYRKALAIRQNVLGEQNSQTATSYNNVALCLDDLGQHAEAVPLHRKALAIRQKVLGEQHPLTAQSYDNLGKCLGSQGKHAEALPLSQKALASCRTVLGEQHPQTAQCYNNVAVCLNAQGKHDEALPLFQKALGVFETVRGKQHPETASCCNNVAVCLDMLGKRAEALPLFQKALAIRQKDPGEEHPQTALSYNNLARCLDDQGKHAEAFPLYRTALRIVQKVLGEHHPHTALYHNNVAVCLNRQGKHAEALPEFQKALTIFQKVRGEQHPDTATGYINLGACLYKQGKYGDAARDFQAALLGSEFGRVKSADSGFERSLFLSGTTSSRAALAVCLVRLDKPLQAWEHAESDLARGLLDDLLPSSDTSADADKLARLSKLDEALIPLLTVEQPSAEETRRRDSLAKERDDLLAELARSAVRRSRDRVLPLKDIQKVIPPDSAIVFWLDEDVLEQHLGCVLRSQGSPVWVKLPGSGKDAAWGAADSTLAGRTLAALSHVNSKTDVREALIEQLSQQRITPLEPHLKGVRHLLVVPSGVMSEATVEALTDRYVVSYIPSASVFARGMEKHRALEASSLLVLADPVFTRDPAQLPEAPPHGLLVLSVTPGSLAARLGLRPGDVLLEYDGKKLMTPDDMKPTAGEDRAAIKLWREGKGLGGRIPAGKLGVVFDVRPLADALTEWRKQDRILQGRGEDWQRLPGTRLEARTLTGLVPKVEALLGSDASEQRLDELASSGKLKEFRLLHLATHGQSNSVRPERTALILAQDRLPTPAEAAALVLKGEKPPEGKLTVGRMLEKDWQLDADLVVLSACQTGLGLRTGGEGMLGFTQALLQKGACTVVLSRWKVDDAATALLMERFYRNLLGKRDGLKEGMKRAEALAEAKSWLRTLSRAEAEKRLAALVDGVPRGERGSIKAALPTRKPDAPMDDRPFAHPYYWAAFVLIGDPN